MVQKTKNMGFTNTLAMSFGVVFIVFAAAMFIANSYLNTELIGGKIGTMTLGIIFLIFGVGSVFISNPNRR
jgi:uncharacterized membrane protein (DUF485 family)